MKASPVKKLLNDLCVELGFCLPPDVTAELSKSPPETTAAFTSAIFRYEGLDPDLADSHLVQQVRARVALYFESK